MDEDEVMIVSNRLPVSLADKDGRLVWERSIGGVATALDVVAKRLGARWVGWTGYRKEVDDQELRAARTPKDYIPVQANDKLVEGYYDRFCNGFLWPVLHGMQPPLVPSQVDWDAYKEMNRRFAQAIQQTATPDEIIWVHDYHLMLLPAYLKQAGVKNRVGYFLHVPFCEPGHWQSIPYARELAEGIAQADLIGLQTKRDVQRFKRYLDEQNISTAGPVRAFPIGIDYEAYSGAARRSPVNRLKQAFEKKAAGKKIIFSLSRLDYTKGIMTQLRAVKRFLRGHANRKDVVYKLVVAPSREHLPEYNKLSAAIQKEVDSINSDLGTKDWQPVDYEHKTIGFDEATAWYGAADFLLLLPDADGMNLISKEYVAAHQGDGGMVVLSTATGASEQLDNALLVPPNDPAKAASELSNAFKMSDAERPKRWRAMRQAVQSQDIFWWAERFLTTLRTST